MGTDNWFEETHTAIGYLTDGEHRSSSVPCVIKYSKQTPGVIRIEFTGTRADAARFMSVRGSPFCELHARENDTTFLSDQVFVRNVVHEGRNDSRMNRDWVYRVCSAELGRFSVIRKLSESEVTKRISFTLCGPSHYWFVSSIRTPSFTGEAEVHSHKMTLDFSSLYPISVQVEVNYLNESIKDSKGLTISAPIRSLTIETLKAKQWRVSRQKFSQIAEELVEDLCLLASFISSNWVSWFRYYLTVGSSFITTVRSLTDITDIEVSQFDEFIYHSPPQSIETFYENGISRLRDLAKLDFDIRVPIRFYILASRDLNIETKFSLFFLCLEKLKDLHAKEQKLETIIDKSDFKKFAKSLRSTADQILCEHAESVREEMKKKIPDLNRYSFASLLEQLLKKYNVEWKDLYPSEHNDRIHFIQTRNEMFHSSTSIAPEQIARECERLKITVQRLLLAILGWRRNPVRDRDLQWLTKEI